MARSRGSFAALAALVVACHAVLVGGGALLQGPAVRVDVLGVELLTRRFEPALAPGLFAALGPHLPFYGALVVFVLAAALLGRWRRAPRTVLAAVLAVLLALELWSTGGLLFERSAPLALDPALPLPDDWRFAWQAGGSYPSRHALLAGALSGVSLLAWLPLGLAAIGLTLCGGATAVYFGAAHVTDVTVGLLLGGAASAAGWLGAGLVRFGRLR
jgi:membrane-associated phospholipid phosphatase